MSSNIVIFFYIENFKKIIFTNNQNFWHKYIILVKQQYAN